MSIGFICLVICFWSGLVGVFRALTGWRLPERVPRHSVAAKVTVDEIRSRLAQEIGRKPAPPNRFDMVGPGLLDERLWALP
jgi:hypothetical protein